MSTRPPLGAHVVLERGGIVWHEAEVLRYDEDDIVLAGLESALTPGAAPVSVVLAWSAGNGVFRVEAEIRHEARECRATPVAEPHRTQRREFARLPMGTAMRLSSATGTRRATLVDISEAALRARIAGSDDQAAGLEPGEHVGVAFSVHQTTFVLQGTVLREQEGEDPDAVDVVVLLDIPAGTANDLRRTTVLAQVEREQRPPP